MSALTRVCINAFSAGLRSFTGCSKAVQTLANRNFHIMSRPILETNTISPTTTNSIIPAFTLFSKFLQPINTTINQVAGFKVKGKLRRRCKDCYFVVRHQRHYVICPTHRRHKQMSMKKRDYKTWILTHATQSKERPY